MAIGTGKSDQSGKTEHEKQQDHKNDPCLTLFEQVTIEYLELPKSSNRLISRDHFRNFVVHWKSNKSSSGKISLQRHRLVAVKTETFQRI